MTDPWLDGISAVQNEADGIVAVHVVRRKDARRLQQHARAGHPDAIRLMMAVATALRQIEQAPPGDPMVCGSCPRPLVDKHFAIVVVTPDRDNPTNALTLAICETCGKTRAQIHQAATSALRTLWPETRPITIHASEGRA